MNRENRLSSGVANKKWEVLKARAKQFLPNEKRCGNCLFGSIQSILRNNLNFSRKIIKKFKITKKFIEPIFRTKISFLTCLAPLLELGAKFRRWIDLTYGFRTDNCFTEL